ncbi:MAG: DUF1624 domain-containing protein [Candidatus Thermoplasmatota archaeon]|nr:DUF1624 domain-containing protein [Candidatus Thermoplasmatota archaeon]
MDPNRNQKEETRPSTRFIELDILRGCAILFMIILHVFWDLDYFGFLPLNTYFYSLNIIVPVMFFLLVGICLSVNNNKYQHQPQKMYIRMIQRGLWILNLGILLTLLTAVFLPDRPILFGVLHCIGCCIILSTLLLKFKSTNIIFATLIIVTGLALGFFYTTENPTMAELATGIHESDVGKHTIDYFPILPWFGICLLGITLGNILYKDNKRRYYLPDLTRNKPTKILSWMGQHSLAIYLVHQPVIAGVLFLIVRI